MIEHYQFGTIQVNGRRYQGDIKIIEGRVVDRWWRREGHVLDVADVEDLLAARPAYLVVGTGQSARMFVAESIYAATQAARIQLIEEPTDQAVLTFNRLVEAGVQVAGAFHLTC